MNITERFLKYVSFDTQSAEDAGTTPSTAKQLDLARYLRDELTELGLTEVELDENGYLYATLPANTTKNVPTVGFIAHMDTSPDCSGADVKPRIVKGYDGGDITLDAEAGIVTSPAKFPELLDHVGEDIMVARRADIEVAQAAADELPEEVVVEVPEPEPADPAPVEAAPALAAPAPAPAPAPTPEPTYSDDSGYGNSGYSGYDD